MASVERIDPTASGWANVRAQLEGEGALAAREKALIAAMVAATRGRDGLCATEAARLAELGGSEDVVPAAAALALARGRSVADALAGAAGVELEWGMEIPPDPQEDEVAAAREFFAPDGAAVPAPIELLARHAPQHLLGYRELREGAYAGLEARLVELALFAVCAGDYVAPHAASHATRALAAGATEAQLVEAGLCAVPAAGMGAWLVAAGAIAEAGAGEGR